MQKNRIRIDFDWKSFFIFWLKAAGATLHRPAKSSEKNIFGKSTNFMFNSNSRPWKCNWTEFESILVEKFSFHFWLKAAGADLRKVLKKIHLENPTISCWFAKAGPENANEQHSNRFWLKKFHFIFGLKPQARPVKKSEKKIFENPPILCSIATAGPENAREQNSNWFCCKSFFHFSAQGRRHGPAKKSEKNIFWKSTNFMFNRNSRPRKCKRTELESILVEKVSFNFLAQGRRRGPAKNSEKNIFWKSTNFMFNSNSRRWECKRTELESILVEKVSFHFLASRPQARTCEKIWKKYVLKIHQFYVQ